MPGPQNITVGRIVHYMLSGQTLAAIVSRVCRENDDTVNLEIFMPDGGTSGKMNVGYSDKPAEGKWSWPPKA